MLIAAQDAGLSPIVLFGVALVVIPLMLFMFMTLFLKQYKRCPPNRVLVVYGKTGPEGGARCVHGSALLVLPLLQDYGWLALEPFRLEVSRQKTSSGRTIDDPLPRMFSVAIGTTPELMETAARRLLGLSEGEIKRHAEDVIVAQLDRLLDAIESGQLQPGTDAYYERLQSAIGAELAPLGLVLINVRRE